jgi:hypothetical protein
MRPRTVLAAVVVGLVLIVLSAVLTPSLLVIAAAGVCVLMALVGHGHEVAR